MEVTRNRVSGVCTMLALLVGLSAAASMHEGGAHARARRSIPAPSMDLDARPSEKTADVQPEIEVVHKRSKRSTSVFEESDIAQILAHNNALRAQEGASDMQQMSWNSELADMAQEWAEGCNWGHGQPARDNPPFSYIGQNLYFTTATNLNTTKGTQMWYDEKEFYTYGAGCQPGQVCGHYTQVVWATTREVGCGYHFCNNLIGEWDGSYYVCNYGPAGNWVGQLPYNVGVACSQCSTTQFCVDNLCADEQPTETNATTTAVAPTEPGTAADTYGCEVHATGEVITFDGETLVLPSAGKVTLSLWNEDLKDPCKYELNAQADASGMSWFALNVGVHKNPKKTYRSLTFGRKQKYGFEARGQKGPGAVTLPYTFTSSDQQTIVTVDGNENDGFVVTSETCPYELKWEPKSTTPKLTFTLTDSKYTSSSAGPEGIC